MAKLLNLIISFMIVTLIWPGMIAAQEEKKKPVNERILEILIEKNIITKEQYEDLLKQAKEEESAEKERLAKEKELKKKKEEGKKPKVAAGFKNGFYLETEDKESIIRLRGRFQGDFKAYLGDNPNHDSFFVRRARLALAGRLFKYYSFRIEGEFAGSPKLNDGFMNVQYFRPAQFLFGQFKVPYSMEEMHSDNWIDFIERSIANKIAPSRDIGMMFHGDIGDDLFYYQIGLFDGYKKNAADVDDGKDLAGRVVIAPFLRSGLKALEGLRLGGSFTYGNEDLTASQWWNSGKWKTAGGTTYMAMNNSTVQSGRRTRGGLELYWDWGSTKLQGEYMMVNLEGLRYGDLKSDYSISGGYITLSHCLTGEKFVFKKGKPGRIVPLRPFRIGGPGWGAWQIGVRFEFVKGDQGLLDQGFVDPTKYTNKATGFSLGINWYPVSMVRFMLNYYHMKFGDEITVEDTKMDHEDVVLTRCELVL